MKHGDELREREKGRGWDEKKEGRKSRDEDRAGELFNWYHEPWRWTEKEKKDEMKTKAKKK